MFTAQSQPMVIRENSGFNHSTMAIANFTAQSTVNSNPYAKPTGNKCYRCGDLGYRSSTCPKQAIVNLVVAEEGKAKVEQEGKKVYNNVDPYAYNPNKVQKDEEGESLGRSLVIQRLLLTLRVDYSDQ